jgi:hypothetical protein
MIGNTLLEFLDGKLALTIRDNRVSVEHLEN